jgi:hypothetical protein
VPSESHAYHPTASGQFSHQFQVRGSEMGPGNDHLGDAASSQLSDCVQASGGQGDGDSDPRAAASGRLPDQSSLRGYGNFGAADTAQLSDGQHPGGGGGEERRDKGDLGRAKGGFSDLTVHQERQSSAESRGISTAKAKPKGNNHNFGEPSQSWITIKTKKLKKTDLFSRMMGSGFQRTTTQSICTAPTCELHRLQHPSGVQILFPILQPPCLILFTIPPT